MSGDTAAADSAPPQDTVAAQDVESVEEPFTALGAYLTGSEAAALATQLEIGMPMFKALDAIAAPRRGEAKRLLGDVGRVGLGAGMTASVLRTVAGAKSVLHALEPVWTMPGNEATDGHLTGEFHRLVVDARQSVTCATFNFETTSQMWDSLAEASNQPGVVVTVYVDRSTADAQRIRLRMPRATLYQSATTAAGRPIVSHAKFVVIDHRLLLLTSANFSYSAENRNIELGLLVDNPALAASIERTMASKHGTLYELVGDPT